MRRYESGVEKRKKITAEKKMLSPGPTVALDGPVSNKLCVNMETFWVANNKTSTHVRFLWWMENIWRFWPSFFWWQPILWSKLAYSPSFIALAFQNWLEYCNAIECINSCNDLATSFENLMNFGPVTLEFTRVVGVPYTPSSIIFN